MFATPLGSTPILFTVERLLSHNLYINTAFLPFTKFRPFILSINFMFVPLSQTFFIVSKTLYLEKKTNVIDFLVFTLFISLGWSEINKLYIHCSNFFIGVSLKINKKVSFMYITWLILNTCFHFLASFVNRFLIGILILSLFNNKYVFQHKIIVSVLLKIQQRVNFSMRLC